MSKKLKHREFNFNLGVLIRWVFFALIIYFSINYLSNGKSSLNTNFDAKNINILGISSEPVIIKATQLVEDYKQQAVDYVNSQLVDIKKQVVTKLYQEIINNIENSQK
ncbi:MAG: hypothetical protein US68_C0002G0005 [Candidatus Shapirobacteria bacterium GW2011_GWE1_38_10]|uniref:Uncharacterized protein n=1 Tax=Candidatus Shapirobacteria bacterium GW2011_GWE1_38_10 TaxID=1618488 RepID=A0A0G0I5Z2_9BACT|nr:MAG: hypothetical protein US46_C0010G0005 [Candidatus Shapirobacteria bacterium GW2011_GWF2_37_20]KKQ50728.1 MAG: hypothetical protein US68_C0002G0005 [Candidatus Shapirobacteria bacterium GW2011_GWE1_38_10]KKQ64477.1 MAG: hypothetical protein US85_C0008G0006 [Candidatus Shapirobacteria bacterium GW2011_GWF1_38_23]